MSEQNNVQPCKNCGEPIQPCSPWGWHHLDGPVQCGDNRENEAEPVIAPTLPAADERPVNVRMTYDQIKGLCVPNNAADELMDVEAQRPIELPDLLPPNSRYPERHALAYQDCVTVAAEGDVVWTRQQRDGLQEFTVRLLDEIQQREVHLSAALQQAKANEQLSSMVKKTYDTNVATLKHNHECDRHDWEEQLREVGRDRDAALADADFLRETCRNYAEEIARARKRAEDAEQLAQALGLERDQAQAENLKLTAALATAKEDTVRQCANRAVIYTSFGGKQMVSKREAGEHIASDILSFLPHVSEPHPMLSCPQCKNFTCWGPETHCPNDGTNLVPTGDAPKETQS